MMRNWKQKTETSERIQKQKMKIKRSETRRKLERKEWSHFCWFPCPQCYTFTTSIWSMSSLLKIAIFPCKPARTRSKVGEEEKREPIFCQKHPAYAHSSVLGCVGELRLVKTKEKEVIPVIWFFHPFRSFQGGKGGRKKCLDVRERERRRRRGSDREGQRAACLSEFQLTFLPTHRPIWRWLLGHREGLPFLVHFGASLCIPPSRYPHLPRSCLLFLSAGFSWNDLNRLPGYSREKRWARFVRAGERERKRAEPEERKSRREKRNRETKGRGKEKRRRRTLFFLSAFQLTILSDSPTHLEIASGGFKRKKDAYVCEAMARAISVLPVPGGPNNSHREEELNLNGENGRRRKTQEQKRANVQTNVASLVTEGDKHHHITRRNQTCLIWRWSKEEERDRGRTRGKKKRKEQRQGFHVWGGPNNTPQGRKWDWMMASRMTKRKEIERKEGRRTRRGSEWEWSDT